MSSTFKTVTVPEKTEEAHVATTCDICKLASTPNSPSHGGEVDWLTVGNEFEEITISRASGVRVRDCGDQTRYSYHICPKCWDSHLALFLSSIGAEPTVKKTDW